MIALLETDISVLKRQKSKKLPFKKQQKVIQLFNNLFNSGFTLTEIVSFLRRSQLLQDSYVDSMQESLLSGATLADMMARLGFSDTIVTQIALADVHGNCQQSLVKIDRYLASMSVVRKKLIEVATYPLILLSFLILIMLGLKNYLLPQLESQNLATQIIAHFPMIFLGSFVLLGLAVVLGFFYARRLSPIYLFSQISRLPIIGRFIRLYLTAYYAREWGNLIGQGIDLMEIVALMQHQKSRLFQEIGKDMQQALLSGQSFHQKVLDYPFFLRELSLMIEYGEVKSKLGRELDIYAEETWQTFFSQLTQATQLIQPLVFVFVALIIVLIYVAMLLPMYQNMGGNF
ncbi:competence protein ComGB [Streptococcus equinus]|nr:competence protein ComGB [Streptococcus equinus]